MADNTKIGPIFRSANGGLSDDLFTGIRNSFYYSNNIEIREDAKSIYPKQSPTGGLNFDLGTIAGRVVNSIYFNDYWYIFCEHDVFKLDILGETCASLGVNSRITRTIQDAELFNGYVYFSTSRYLYRISQTEADASWSDSSNFIRMDLNLNDFHPLYATDVLLAVGNGAGVSKVTKEVPDQLQSGIELQSDYNVRFLDELGGFLRITATDGHYGNEILLWDKVSSMVDEVIPMTGYKFLQSCIYNGYHYLLSNKGLGLVNGYQFYILKKAEQEEIYVAQTPKNGMIVYDDKLYFVNKEGIYIYGAKNKNYTDVLNLWSAPLKGKNDYPGIPSSIGTDGNTLIYSEQRIPVGGSQTHTYIYVYNNGEKLGEEGELWTMGYFGNSLSEIKQAMYLRVGYGFQTSQYFSATGTIHIFYRTEASKDWIRLTDGGGLKPSSDARSPFATTLKLNCRFQWIQFKFILIQNNNAQNYDGPLKLYSADLYYNDMLD